MTAVTFPNHLHDTARGAGPTTVPRVTFVRRRLAAAGVVVAVVLVTAQAGAALGGSALDVPGRAPAAAPAPVPAGAAAVVRPGDSLWSIAQRLAPGEDPRPVVDALEQARRGAPLLVGETIRWDG